MTAWDDVLPRCRRSTGSPSRSMSCGRACACCVRKRRGRAAFMCMSRGVMRHLLGAKGGKWFDARYEIKVQGGGSNLGNVKIVKKPILPAKTDKVSSELYKDLRAKTPSAAIRKAVNKDVVLPMKDPALPGLQVTKSLHADHIVPMKAITEMSGFSKLTFADQVKVLNYERNFQGLSEVANTSKGAKSFGEWVSYKKGGIDVDPAFRSSMIDKAAKLEPEIQQHITNLLLGY
ncbi:hypothetical protein PS874_05163 [Pseudomonas fluorescens]|nr:hypothetical protein PS874_05163 [Pseudomonas fluorescens]